MNFWMKHGPNSFLFDIERERCVLLLEGKEPKKRSSSFLVKRKNQL
jgi:hypothetical protein